MPVRAQPDSDEWWTRLPPRRVSVKPFQKPFIIKAGRRRERDGIKIEKKKKERRKEREEAKVQKLTHDGERINYTLYPRVIVARELCLAATTNRDSNYCQLRPRHGTDDLQRGAFRKFTHGLLQFHFFTLSFSSPPFFPTTKFLSSGLPPSHDHGV